MKKLIVLPLIVLLALSLMLHVASAMAVNDYEEMPREWFGKRKVVDKFERYTRIAIIHYVVDIGDPDGDGAADGYELMGVRWNLNNYLKGIPYIINPSGGVKQGLKEDSIIREIKEALEAWDYVVSAKLFNDKPLIDYKAKASIGSPDFRNIITWGRAQPSIVAYTVIWYDTSTGLIVDADMVLNSYYKWGIADGDESTSDLKGKFDIRNIVTHEAGHWIGLDDLYDQKYWAMTMYGYASYGEEIKRSLEPGDIAGAQAIYGP